MSNFNAEEYKVNRKSVKRFFFLNISYSLFFLSIKQNNCFQH